MKWGMKNYTIMLFGSSIMEGRIGAAHAADRWYEQMRATLSERFPATCFAIRNCAVGGESTRELMAHLDSDLAGFTPDLCIAMFGWNNFVLDSPERFVSVQEQNALIERFFGRMPASTKVVGVITQPMVDKWHAVNTNAAFDDIRKQYGSVNAYHNLERDNARKCFRDRHIPFLDLSVLMGDNAEPYILPSDGIHLSPEGHALFASAMADFLAPFLEQDGNVTVTPRNRIKLTVK